MIARVYRYRVAIRTSEWPGILGDGYHYFSRLAEARRVARQEGAGVETSERWQAAVDAAMGTETDGGAR